MGALIEVKNLEITFSVRGTRVPAVQNISLRIGAGEAIGLIGESGSGKSATALSLVGLLPRSAKVSGEILYKGRNLLKEDPAVWESLRGAKIAMIFQDPMTSLNPVMPVLDQVAEVLQLHQRVSKTEARQQASTLLEEVGIFLGDRLAQTYPHELSGGQRQRAMIAMAIACRPELLIADEPTTALDTTVQKQVLDLLISLQKKYGMALLFITHNLALVRKTTDKIYVMSQGKIVESGPTKEVLTQPRHEYTKMLLSQKVAFQEGAHADAAVVLEVKGLVKTYTKKSPFLRRTVSTVEAMKGVDLQLRRGRTLGLVGESASGKSTLARTVLRLTPVTDGKIIYGGRDITWAKGEILRSFRGKIQIVFQDPAASLNPRHTAEQTLCEAMEVNGIGKNRGERLSQARDLMEKVGLNPEWLNRFPHEFSGGQRQRLCIARAISVKPELLVLDEAVSSLDATVQNQILQLLADLKREMNLTYLFISHDLAVVRAFSDDLAVMNRGEIIEAGRTEDVFKNPRQAYTRQLLEATLS
jgi:peptide/nickel transport system ATP-binding protein